MLAKLRAALETKLAEMRKLSESTVDEKGNVRKFTEDEQKRYDDFKAQVEETKSAIERELAIEESRSAVAKLDQVVEKAPRIEVTRAENHDERGVYRGFKSLGEQLRSVAQATRHPSDGVDKRLLEVRAAAGMNSVNDSEGGFLLQNDFIVDLDGSAMARSSLIADCLQVEIGEGKNGFTYINLNESSRADGSRAGGVQAYWEEEAGQITATKPTFKPNELKLKKLTALIHVTDEQLEDSAVLGSLIPQLYGEEIGFKIDAGIIEGDGVGKMKGILESGALQSVTKVTSQTADTVVAGNVVSIYSRAFPRAQASGTWLVNPEVWAQLPLMTIGDQPMFVPPGGLSGAPLGGTLLGRPVKICEACPKLGDAGDIIFANLKKYLVIQKGGIKAASSIHVYFDTAQQSFRFIKRINGQPWHDAAMTPYKGNTGVKYSDFVTVENRA